MLLYYIIVLFLFLSTAASVVFEDCGSEYELYSVEIEGCGNRLPCYVTLGENVTVKMVFGADFPSSQLDQNVIININYINLEATVTPEQCEEKMCPIRTQITNYFNSIMSVPTSMALNQRGYLRWRVYNEKNQLVLCFSVLVQTQNLLQKRIREAMSSIKPAFDSPHKLPCRPPYLPHLLYGQI